MISHYTLESPISFGEGEINYLVIEDQRQMVRYVSEMIGGIGNQDSGFVLSHENDILDLPKYAELIVNPFVLDPNSTATLGYLLQKMRKDALGDNQLRTDEMISVINSTIGEIIREQHPSVVFSENLDVMKLFKFLDVRFSHVYDDMLENICEYLLIKRDYSSVKLFVFVNLRCFLNTEELHELYRFAAYNKINVLLLENHTFDPVSPEKVRIIDKDLCEIGENTEMF